MLLLLAAPLICQILRALSEGPQQQTDLRLLTGQPAQTTLRAQLKKLTAFDAIGKSRRNRFPGNLEYELSTPGWRLLPVMEALEAWLAIHPGEPLTLGEPSARSAVKALSEAWSTSMLRALAAKPLTLTELDGIIASHNYPSLERRLSAMRLAGLVEARGGFGRGKPYAVADWTRRAVTPLIAAAGWEREHIPLDSAMLGKLDAEAALLLALPMLRLPAEVSGLCRMAVQTSTMAPDFAGAMVEVHGGRIASCTTRLQGHPDAWVAGTAPEWLSAVIDRDLSGLEFGGYSGLGRNLVEGMHDELFGALADRTAG